MILCNLKSKAQENTFGYRWNMHTTDYFFEAIKDSTEQPSSILFVCRPNENGKIGTLIPVYQLNNDEAEITISINYKTQKCKTTCITLNVIGDCERVLNTKTIPLPNSKNWNSITKKIKIKDAELLNIFIEGAGNDKMFGKLWVSYFNVTSNGKRLENYADPKKGITPVKKTNATAISSEQYQKIPSMQTRIMAIGETIHGSKTLGTTAFDIIKQRIMKQNCRLVLHEFPMEYSFYVNRYIKNDPHFSFADIERYMEGNLSSEQTLSFIQWLRSYNAAHNNEVSMWGIDFESMDLASSIDFYEFVKTLTTNIQSAEIDSLAKRFINWELTPKDSLELLEPQGAVGKWMTSDERELMRFYLRGTRSYQENYERLMLRDGFMAEAAQKIIKTVLKQGETASIYGHFIHLNYLTAGDMKLLNNRSMGHYMKLAYKEDYQCIALCTYEGETLNAVSEKSIAISRLADAPKGSIERAMHETGYPMAYLSTEKLSCSDVFTMRILGNSNDKQQFFYFMPKARVDGVLFLQQSQPVVKSQATLTRYLNYIDATIRRFLESKINR